MKCPNCQHEFIPKVTAALRKLVMTAIGSKPSEARNAAARENGKFGGRPRKGTIRVRFTHVAVRRGSEKGWAYFTAKDRKGRCQKSGGDLFLLSQSFDGTGNGMMGDVELDEVEWL